MKLTKPQLKIHKQAEIILQKETLTFEDKEYLYEHFNEGAISDVTSESAYFTPLDLAYDFALFAGRYGVCVDMCAGFGVLSFCARVRDTYHNNIKHQICIERNPKFVEIGKKLLPEAEWIEGDVFDKNIWDYIKNKYGTINSIVSNPPFGKVTKTDCNRSWLKYTGAELDIACMEIAMLNCQSDISMLLPVGSVEFKYSGRPYFDNIENKKISKLRKETGIEFVMTNPGIDTSVYEQFKNTKIIVEHVDFVDIVIPE